MLCQACSGFGRRFAKSRNSVVNSRRSRCSTGKKDISSKYRSRAFSEAFHARFLPYIPAGIRSWMPARYARPIQLGFRAEKFNEAEYARAVAKQFGTDHSELVVNPDLGETLNYLSTMLEEPFGDSSMLPTYYVSRTARK